ncbi:17620_t:CDS:2, partial [Funneliformis geosporum]
DRNFFPSRSSKIYQHLQFQDKAAAKIGRIGAGVTTGADIIPNGTWDEDWSIAGGEPVDNVLVAPNARGGFPAVTIASGIKLGQLLYLFRTSYTTVKTNDSF